MGDVIEISRARRPRPADPECEAEREILAATLAYPAVARAFAALMPPEWMTYEQHRQIFESVCAVVRDGRPVNLITVAEKLMSRSQYDETVANYLLSLVVEKKHDPAS